MERKKVASGKKDSHILLGAHMSIKDGFAKAVQHAAEIGCTALQFFTKSNRQWSAKDITQEEIDQFTLALRRYGISQNHVMVHASYLINLASGKKRVATMSLHALQKELARCDALGVPYLVLHPGSSVESETGDAVMRFIDALNAILAHGDVKTMVLIENMAGQGRCLGASFEQLADIFNGLDAAARKHVGFCIDTCHLFAAGYKFDTPGSFKKMWEEWDKLIGCKHIRAFHINDSKGQLGCHVDRHEHIGKGHISLASFQLFLHEKRFVHTIKIIETPQVSLADHQRNLEILLNL